MLEWLVFAPSVSHTGPAASRPAPDLFLLNPVIRVILESADNLGGDLYGTATGHKFTSYSRRDADF